LHFVLAENAGNTEPGELHKIKYADSYGHVLTHSVDHQDVVPQFFASCIIKCNRHPLQMKNSFLQPTTIHIGINMTDAFLLASYHKLINLNDDAVPSKLSIQ
jgi:hypothetical protein